MNEIFALHLDDELITSNSRQKIWEKYSKNYGKNGLYGWKAPKPYYSKIGHAKTAIKHLPEIIRDNIKIVRYIPEGESSEQN
jgi:hypothetical protein